MFNIPVGYAYDFTLSKYTRYHGFYFSTENCTEISDARARASEISIMYLSKLDCYCRGPVEVGLELESYFCIMQKFRMCGDISILRIIQYPFNIFGQSVH